MAFWESIAYAIARGIARAWFDTLDERELAVREVPNAEDRVRARRMRDAVERVRTLPDGGAGPNGAASGGAGGGGGGVVPGPGGPAGGVRGTPAAGVVDCGSAGGGP